MALILALNPGNIHSPTLSRLARELPGCELIGAESSAVAISAIKKRVPDVILLPAKQARGQADLIKHLKSVPGGVMTLQLPSVDSADPVDLARQIREMLTGVPVTAVLSTPELAAPIPATPPRAAAVPMETAPVGASPQLLAAAAATVRWIHTRRQQWIDEPPAEPPAAAPVSAAAEFPFPPEKPFQPFEPTEYQPYEPIALSDSDDPYPAMTPEPAKEEATSRPAWLPRAAAIGAAIVVAGGIALYWSQMRDGSSGTNDEQTAPVEAVKPAEVTPEPVAPPPAATPTAEPDPLAKVSGWVAVFAPFDITISEGGRGLQVDDRGRVMLAPGKRRLRFQNRALGYDETRVVEVRPTDTTTVNLAPETTIAVTSSVPAEVLIDGTRAGDTPYEGKIRLGTHTVIVKTADAERQRTVEATSKPVQLEVDFSQP